VFFFTVAVWKKGYTEAGEGLPVSAPLAVSTEILPRHLDTRQNWQNLPGGKYINKPLMSLAYTRERFLFERSHGNTNYLPEVHLDNGLKTIQFFPKALQLSLLEPLPFRTIDGGGARKLLFMSVQLEMLLVYASLFFLLFSGRKSWKPAVFVCIALALPFLLSLGVAVPNVGTINRYRFPFLILIKLAGLAALWNASRLKWPGRLLMWVNPPKIERAKKKVIFLVPDDITFLIQRLVMAQGAQKAGYDVHVASEDTGVSDKVTALGFTFHRLDLNRGGLNPFADFRAFIKLVFFLAKERPDILQCVSIKPVLYGATAGTIVGLNRIVCLVNGLGYAFEAKGFKGKIVFNIAKTLYRNALALPGVRVVFQNPDDQEYFVENKLVDAHKTILIRGSGVNMEKFKPTPQPQNPRPIVLFVGRLLWSKGIQDLIDAAKILKAEKIDFSLKIVGQPDDRNPEAVPNKMLEDLHEQGIIEWLGRQTDMPKFYRESDIVVLPTTYREGLPLTLLEAASTGRALVATDVPGCREVVSDQVNGFLVPPKNVLELTNALRKLLLDPELRRKFGEAGSVIVRDEFSSQIVQTRLSNVYETLLNDSDGHNLTPVTST
jgi:glycosyltransferase involved in cell wall biosynthesis